MGGPSSHSLEATPAFCSFPGDRTAQREGRSGRVCTGELQLLLAKSLTRLRDTVWGSQPAHGASLRHHCRETVLLQTQPELATLSFAPTTAQRRAGESPRSVEPACEDGRLEKRSVLLASREGACSNSSPRCPAPPYQTALGGRWKSGAALGTRPGAPPAAPWPPSHPWLPLFHMPRPRVRELHPDHWVRRS